MLDTVTGYRRQCIEAGFSEESAEAMCVDYHRRLLAWVVKGQG